MRVDADSQETNRQQKSRPLEGISFIFLTEFLKQCPFLTTRHVAPSAEIGFGWRGSRPEGRVPLDRTKNLGLTSNDSLPLPLTVRLEQLYEILGVYFNCDAWHGNM
jgi:hypothetical protein